jgi:NAD(P)-dependent dehydrogenase (short-subunit alcohol dehydrogenase family)
MGTLALQGRYALITGASRGLGAVIAEHYVGAGASVLLCARTEAPLNELQKALAAHLRPGQQVLARVADLADTRQIDALVRTALAAFPHLDIVVNNAGVHGPLGPLEETEWVEWTKAVSINLLGTVYLCRAVLPHFKARRYGKIINLSGGGATSPLPRFSAYAASKAAVVRFTETLAEEVKDFGIDVNAVAPGALATRLIEEVIETGPEKVGAAYYERMVQVRKSGGTPLERPAALCVYLGSAASDGLTGKLISAVWDPWEVLHTHLDELRESDIYTLRRIVPRDRGKTWGEIGR